MIIGISGKARSGKDQFGDYLIDCFEKEYGKFFLKTAFANSLKMMCRENFGLDSDQVWGDKKEIPDERFPKNPDKCTYWSPREIMQEIGSFYRKINYDFWVKELDKEIKKFAGRIDNFIITDVRHINECEYIKNKNGILIRVVRKSADEIHGMNHESETALDDFNNFDIEINNDGTLEDLRKAAKDAAFVSVTLENLMKTGRIING